MSNTNLTSVRNKNGKRETPYSELVPSNTKKIKIDFDEKLKMITTAISRRCMVINSVSVLNINNIILTLYNALKLGTSNPNLNKDDYMLLNKLLLSSKFSEVSTIMKKFLLCLEFFPLEENDDYYNNFYINFSKAFSYYLRTKKHNSVQESEQKNNLKSLEDLEEELNKIISKKLAQINDEKKIAFVIAKHVISSSLGTGTHSFVLLNAKLEVKGNHIEIFKLFDINNKNKIDFNKLAGHLKQINIEINKELLKDKPEKTLSDIVFEYLNKKDLKLDNWNKKLIFNQFFNLETISEEQIRKKRTEFKDGNTEINKYTNIEKLEVPLRLAVQTWIRSGYKLKKK